LSKISRISSGLTTPSPEETRIVVTTTAMVPR
jgi:hypothetical protein